MARTGFGSRFLLGTRTSSYFGRVLLTVVLLSIGFFTCLASIVAGARGLRQVLDPGSEMYRLNQPASAAAPGQVARFSAPVRAEHGETPPICDVIHEHYVSGKNGGWRRDMSWARAAGAAVGAFRIRANEPVAFDPLDPLVVGADQEPWFRTVLADVPYGGRLRAHCVASGETVFLEGCLDADGAHLTGCGATPLTVTTGDGTAQPRIDAHADKAASRLARGAGAIVAALGYLWYLLRARPLAAALLRRAGMVPHFTAWPQVIGLAGAAVVGAIAQVIVISSAPLGSAASRGRPGYLVGLLVCAVAAVFAVVVRHRRQTLERAMAPVREAETVPLASARGGVVELAVSVRDGGAPVAGVLDAGPHAWVEVRVEETCAHGKTQVTHLAARRYWPAQIPVRDASGDGLLDLAHAELDLRSTVTTFKQGSASEVATALARSPVGPLTASAGHLHWTVEQSVLHPGEQLYVLGQCTRIEDPKGASSYRADSTMPVVGGAADAKIIVHAGDERSLLRSIGLERSYLDLLTAALAGVAASLAVTMLALWAL